MSKAHIELWKTGPEMKSGINLGWTREEWQRHRLKEDAKKKPKKKHKAAPKSMIHLLHLCDLFEEYEVLTKRKLLKELDIKHGEAVNLMVAAENSGLLLYEGYNEVGQVNAAEFKKKWQPIYGGVAQ